MNRAQLVEAAEIIAEGIHDDEEVVVQRLVERGFAEAPAHRLMAFLPSAFARPILEKLGAVDFSAEIGISTASGRTIRVRLVDQPEYVEALALAREHVRHGILRRGVFEAIVGGTAEIDAVSGALSKGAAVEGSSIATVLLWTVMPPMS